MWEGSILGISFHRSKIFPGVGFPPEDQIRFQRLKPWTRHTSHCGHGARVPPSHSPAQQGSTGCLAALASSALLCWVLCTGYCRAPTQVHVSKHSLIPQENHADHVQFCCFSHTVEAPVYLGIICFLPWSSLYSEQLLSFNKPLVKAFSFL